LPCMKKISVEDAYCEGQRVMGRSGNTLGTLLPGSPEDKRFRGYFGVSAEVVVDTAMVDVGPSRQHPRGLIHCAGRIRTLRDMTRRRP